MGAARALAKVAGRRSVFKGAELSRLWFDWIASPISADQEIYNDFLRLRARAREMRRNHPLIKAYLRLLENNVVGPDGMRLQARVRNADGKLNKRLNAAIQEAWDDWSDMVTVDCTMGLTDVQHHLLRALAVDGEICVRRVRSYADNPYRYALQVVDPDLLDHQFFRGPGTGAGQNEIRLGVEINEWGRPVAYWFWDRHPTDLINISARKRIRVPADELTHLYIADRVNQSRGVTWLNSIMMPSKMLDGYVEAEVVAARIGASKMGFVQTKDGADFVPPEDDEKLDIEATPGSFEQLPPGTEFKEWNPEHPSTAFPNFLKSLLRWIASGLGASYNLLANDLEGVNYSSIRAGLLMDRDEWRKLQRWWARRFLKPLYAEWLQFAVLSNQLTLDTRDWKLFLRVKFVPRGWDWVDPLKDTNAAIAEVDNGLNSRTRICAEQGLDFEDVAEELAAEQEIIDELGLELTGVGVGPGAAAGDKPEDGEQEQDSGQSARARRRARLARNQRQHLALVRGLAEREA
jgi:lambda family phage portal protein